MSGRKSDYEEKLLKDIKDTDGIKKIQDPVATTPSLKTPYDWTLTRDANGRISQYVITDGVTTKTGVITRDANGRISAIDETIT